MVQLIALLLGAAAGFGGSRLLRRPASTARAASVARSVGSAVGSRRDLDLPRLQRSVLSEMRRHVVTRKGSAQVPAAFLVRLHPEDHATVQQAPGFFKQGLEEALAAAGRDHGWTMPPRLGIELAIDPSRPRGTPGVDVEPPMPDLPGRSAAGVAAPAKLERNDGQPAQVVTGTVTIGRSADRTIVVDDSRVSRAHATVARTQEGTVVITDEGSSNGTRVNDRAIPSHTPISLSDGDRISVGPVEFVFRVGGQPSAGRSGQ